MKKSVKFSIAACLLFWLVTQANAATVTVEKINVGIGYLEVTNTGSNDGIAVFNLTLQEQNGSTPPTYPYVVYSSECPNGIKQDISSDTVAKNMLFSVLLAAKQGQNYVDVRYEVNDTPDPDVCTLKAITIKYKQN